MGFNFLQALSNAGPAAFKGYNDETQQLEQQHNQQLGHTAGGGYGALLRAMAMQNGVPQPPQAPQGPAAPQGPGGNVVPFPQPKPPAAMPQMGMQAPSGPPGMPQDGPQQGPPSAPPMPQGMPPQGPPGQPPQGQGPQQGGNPFQNLTLSQIVNGIKQTNPSISDEALGMAVDKFLPMMNVQAQMQYHQLMLQNQSRRTDISQQNADQRGSYMTSRLAQFDQSIAQRDTRLKQLEQTSFSRLPANIKGQADALRVRYQQESQNYRSAKYQASMDPSNQQAQQDVTTAQALMFDSQRSYMDFLEKNGGQQPPATGAPPRAAGPAAATGPASPKPIGQGPNGQPLYPVTPAKPAKTSALPDGQGGPLQGTVADSGVVGPVRARPADADIWDNPSRRGQPPQNAPAGSIPDNTVAAIQKPADTMTLASRGPGDGEVQFSAEDSPEAQTGAAIQAAQGSTADLQQMQKDLADLKAAHAKMQSAVDQGPAFQQQRRQASNFNSESNAAEAANPAGIAHDQLRDLYSKLHDLLFPHPVTGMDNTSPSLKKVKPKQTPYGAARAS